jgi:hypothetical protein
MKHLLIIVFLASGFAMAQGPVELSPPPLVPAPPPMPPPEPLTSQGPGTPPPPSLVPDRNALPGQQPGRTGYPYSPYGQPKAMEKPSPEYGLMVSESLFGALTAAGVTVLPYFLLFGGGAGGLFGDETISSVIFVLIFSAAPLAVAQTQVSLANGSRFYQSETWPAALAGLVGMAGVMGIYAATGWLPNGTTVGGVPSGGSAVWLFVGSIGIVPLLQMAVINIFKTPRFGTMLTVGDPVKRQGVAFAPPSIAPVLNPSSGGLAGAQLSLFRGIF